ncbi:GntR family transcriptional regulator [Kutzneria viridogrisea]
MNNMTGPITRPEPLREAVYSRIVALIAGGELAPGKAVTEASLAKELAVSRTPVREALLRLEADGVLRSALAKGFVVKPLLHREAAELYPILATLEGLALTTSSPGQFDLVQLRELADQITEEQEPVHRWQADTRFHEQLVASSGNTSLIELVAKLRTNLSRYELEYMRRVGSREDADQQHREVLDAIEDGDMARAAHSLVRHWQVGMGTVLAWLKD